MRIKLHSPKFGPIGLTFLFLLKKGVIREYTRMTPCQLKNTHQYYNPGKDNKNSQKNGKIWINKVSVWY